ncbi:MAG: hypothetical protein A2271_01905 [Candidatus Moranbacteria bacterium RIFOXYA12_FULL_35_19]|nr:MAG: hypothetical protein UR78_C0017G0017 [Candidatus Moranbacteria bacterium GW2011_GWF2_35_39]OGI32439.1 MAG: hypothetical protein A2489_02365 [Candidatus Moranbacteria bacterium RIFOXYC12_FULL_36_13]OGI35523.1 MAG: hypothetical protein A2271_01905 [Candidatus Moranbacteria bacterium RIFOXYA12_FULL_35_19]
MKNNKKILPLLFIALFSALVIFFFVWVKSKKPVEVAPSQTTTTKPAQKNPDIFFASNGKNTVYKIKKGDQWSVIWNGTEGKAYDFVSNPVFSFDGTQIAYNAEINGQAYVVVNNTYEINAYQKANHIVFSRDGSTIAFVATKGSNAYVVISAEISDISGTLTESEEYSEIGIAQDPEGNSSAIILSENGDRIAYVIIEDDKVYIVIDGQVSQAYDNIISFSFSEDGTDFTYEAQNGDTIVTVVNNQVVSSTEEESATEESETSSTSSSYATYPTPTYRYKISTQKDIVRDQDRLDFSDCPEGSQCNF